MRDTMIIYRSFFEAIKELPKENQAEVWNAVYELGLNGNLIELQGISKTIFTLIKPQIDANLKRFENGKKPKSKQTKSKEEAKPKQELSEVEANNNNNNNNKKNNNKNNNNNTFNFYDSMVSFGFEEQLVKDWIQVRKVKKATNTETAFNGFIREVNKNENSPNFILKNCVERNWSGFKSEWLPKEQTADNTFCWR
jgi:hypothetical protein